MGDGESPRLMLKTQDPGVSISEGRTWISKLKQSEQICPTSTFLSLLRTSEVG